MWLFIPMVLDQCQDQFWMFLEENLELAPNTAHDKVEVILPNILGICMRLLTNIWGRLPFIFTFTIPTYVQTHP
jgi:hypothetical protein